MTPANFLASGPLIIARLKAVLPPDVHVLSASDLAGVAGAHQPTPAVHVVYMGYRPTDTRTGALVSVEQQWLTVVVTRNVADIEQGEYAQQDAGPLAGLVMDALHRQKLRDEQGVVFCAPIQLATAPAPGFDDGHFYLPLAWAVAINFRSDTCPA